MEVQVGDNQKELLFRVLDETLHEIDEVDKGRHVRRALLTTTARIERVRCLPLNYPPRSPQKALKRKAFARGSVVYHIVSGIRNCIKRPHRVFRTKWGRRAVG